MRRKRLKMGMAGSFKRDMNGLPKRLAKSVMKGTDSLLECQGPLKAQVDSALLLRVCHLVFALLVEVALVSSRQPARPSVATRVS